MQNYIREIAYLYYGSHTGGNVKCSETITEKTLYSEKGNPPQEKEYSVY